MKIISEQRVECKTLLRCISILFIWDRVLILVFRSGMMLLFNINKHRCDAVYQLKHLCSSPNFMYGIRYVYERFCGIRSSQCACPL